MTEKTPEERLVDLIEDHWDKMGLTEEEKDWISETAGKAVRAVRSGNKEAKEFYSEQAREFWKRKGVRQ